jgi:hypothetical protein
MGEDVRFASEMEPARRFVFRGKPAIYSAGVTFMSFFARENRYLARGTRYALLPLPSLSIHVSILASTLRGAVSASFADAFDLFVDLRIL